MQVRYLVEIMDPKTHMVNVKLKLDYSGEESLEFFLPRWSPGSYLMREYARNIRTLKVLAENGEYLNFQNKTASLWCVDFKNSDVKKVFKSFSIEYDIYCHELTVRTSHVDESHAFLHGPSYLMGILNKNFEASIEFKFTALWSKINLGLNDISTERSRFIYSAKSYDELIDAPVEIGCHQTDGFMVSDKEHFLVWYGEQFPHEYDLKKDIKKIVETVSSHFSSIPYENYTFMTHLKKNLYGGLEHLNSTALQFDGRKFMDREMYVNWLALVAHEYFHTWNVKRIRPKELGPFDYLTENYTSMHWLTEGLTSFMDELFVLRSGLCTLEEYLKMQAKNLQNYYNTPGKKFHSLEQSSFNTWVKLYRPDENSHNSSISYYLKGGLVFSTLHFEFHKRGKNINELLILLWQRYLEDVSVGVTSEEVFDMIEVIAGKEVREQFEMRITTTEDIDFETYYKNLGMSFDWDKSDLPDLGVSYTFKAEQVVLNKVVLDGTAYKAGLNSGDEILAIDGVRFLKEDADDFHRICSAGKKYNFMISRLGTIMHIEVLLEKKSPKLKQILVDNSKLASLAFS